MPNQNDIYTTIANYVSEQDAPLRALRRELHQVPELGWTEFQTAARVCETLAGLGYQVRTGRDVISDNGRLGVPEEPALHFAYKRAKKAGAPRHWVKLMRGGYTGVIAELDTGKPGPLLAFRFDLDALPIREAAGDGHRPATGEWISQIPGAMHACGHDGHTAIGLTLGQLIVALLPHLCGRIRLIFQPAEEGVRGAVAMPDAVKGVDRLICLHIGLGVPSGVVAGGAVRFLATRELHASFIGQAAHAGWEPESGRSALLAASQAVLALHTLAQSGSDLIRVNAGILRGGVATNIVPPSAELYYRIRAGSNTGLEDIGARADAVVTHSAQTYGCEVSQEVTGHSVSEDSHPKLAQIAADEASRVTHVKEAMLHRNFGASEDATIFMRDVHQQGGQATYILLGADLSAGHHNERFDFDEDALPIGLELLGRLLVRILGT